LADGSLLYGADSQGGAAGCGVVFEAIPAPGAPYTVTSIHDFAGSPDGCTPKAALTLGPGGLLYGTTENGGISTAPCPSSGCGVVFRLQPPPSSGGAWTEDVIYSFTGANGDGASPFSSWSSAPMARSTAPRAAEAPSLRRTRLVRSPLRDAVRCSS
jgi:uncharacterized repeat protein (TIGR03803 family)